MRQRISRRLAILGATVALALSIPLGAALAAHFNDVPNSNPFHADIAALAASKVTTGCGNNNFCPKDFVTREQMAAFMNRLGALSPGKVPVVNADKLDGLDSTAFGVAGGRVTGSNGNLVSWFNRAGGALQVERTGAGVYAIRVPGRSFSNTNFVGTASTIGDPGFTRVSRLTDGRLLISTYNVAGAAADRSFFFVAYDASPGG